MNVKNKKKKGYYESSNSGFANECQCDESVNWQYFSKRVESDSKTIIIICKLGLEKKPTFCDAT